MIGANVGIGSFLLTSGNLMQTDQLMAGIVAIAVLGLLIGALISWLERVLLAWR
jgi:ABC-type nitrate/sulfonate/bicarbonate transport system permease component